MPTRLEGPHGPTKSPPGTRWEGHPFNIPGVFGGYGDVCVIDYFVEFVEAVRRGHVHLRDRFDVAHAPNLADFSGAIPHIDFGSVTFDEEKMIGLGQPYVEALDRVYENPLSLPFDKFALVLRGPKLVEILIVSRTDEENVFCLRSYTNNYHSKHWVAFYDRLLCHSISGKAEFHDSDRVNIDYNYVGKMVSDEYEAVMLCLALLSMESTEQEISASERLASVNRGRAKGKLPPIPDTIRITLGKPTVTSSASIGATGITQRPHDRRGHVRRLKSGRIVPVRAYSVHGGSGVARRYEVTA